MVTDTQFIDAWQRSDSPAEVAKETGMEIRAVYKRATLYRKKGIPLKYFRLRTDVTKLIERAERYD